MNTIPFRNFENEFPSPKEKLFDFPIQNAFVFEILASFESSVTQKLKIRPFDHSVETITDSMKNSSKIFAPSSDVL